MGIKKTDDNIIYYSIIAILCLIIFVLSFKVINKIYFKNKENESINRTNIMENIDYEKTVTTFLNIDGNKKNLKSKEENNTEKNIKKRIDNFYLRVLINSNSHMKTIYKMENPQVKGFSIVEPIFTSFIKTIEPLSYLKAQFPAIVNIVGPSDVSSKSLYTFNNEKEENKDKREDKTSELKDIISVEDPTEAGEGIYIYEQSLEQSGINISDYKEGLQTSEIASVLKVKSIKTDENKPYILLYHTHGTESYYPKKVSNYHTTERKYNVTNIGEIIANSLTEKGQNVKHIDTYHDIPSYNKSYSRSLATGTTELENEKNLKVVFDIHRDAVELSKTNIETANERFKVNINGKQVARFSMVIGPENPNKDELVKFAQYIKAVSDLMYPGLCRGIIIKNYGKFNQYISDHYALIEVGSNINTVEEAEETANLISEILDAVIKGIKE